MTTTQLGNMAQDLYQRELITLEVYRELLADIRSECDSEQIERELILTANDCSLYSVGL